MKQLHYRVRFLTPAFLGNAEQDGQWRTPPFKALLRQWWRVAFAADLGSATSVAHMRAAEGDLFGVAADGNGESRKSRLRIRLADWSLGKQKNWDGLEQASVHHKESERTGYKVGPHAYLGYGPLDGRGNTRFSEKINAAIQANAETGLQLALPLGAEVVRIERALWLLNQYGTLGGRSRNGWGSFSLTPVDGNTPGLDGRLDPQLTSAWQDCLLLDWPHAIGRDPQGPLIWHTAPLPNWQLAMRRLAEIKIGLRTKFEFTTGNHAASPEARHWLCHPVTNHNVAAWKAPGKGEFRLPNSLRFKVRAERDGKLRGVIFHVPCLPPPMFKPDLEAIKGVWKVVHSFLDQPAQGLQRIDT